MMQAGGWSLKDSRSVAGGRAVWMLVAFLTTVPSFRLCAQTEGSVIAALPGSTRSAALAGAGAALVGEAGAVFSNPAGIATVRHLSLEGSHERYLAGSAISTAALALRAGRITWGFGAQALDYGAEPEIVPDPATGGRRGMATGASFHPYEALALSSLVYRRGMLAFGLSAKYDRQQIGSAVRDAWAGDVGVALAVFDIMALGISVQNLGGDMGGGGRLPRRTRAGFTLNYTDPQGVFRLLTTLEGLWPAGGRAARMILGLEGGVVRDGVGVLGRAGYATHSAVTDASHFAAGGAVVLGHLQFDYAFQPYDVLAGGTHRVGLRWTP
jgi:hypothetical protein